MTSLGWSPEEAVGVVRARARLGRFSGPQELAAFGDLPPAKVDDAGELLVFGRACPPSTAAAEAMADEP